jgi:hypothetical protein
VYLVIQKFKTVTCDPIEVTSSWTGVKDRTIASVDFNGYRSQLASLKGFVYRECTALYPLLKDVFIQVQDLVATQPWSIGTTMNRLSSPPPSPLPCLNWTENLQRLALVILLLLLMIKFGESEKIGSSDFLFWTV